MVIKRIAIFANSRKYAGRCVAGIILSGSDYGQWIRPVSDRPGESLNEIERWYSDGVEPSILDIVDIPLVKSKPHSCQVENWLISTQKHWYKQGELAWHEALQFVEDPESLWVNGRSTYSGLNDEITTESAKYCSGSIGLIHVPSLEVHKTRGYTGAKTKIYASFTINKIKYKLSVTDPVFESLLASCDFGNYGIGESLLTISLSEPFMKNDGLLYQYKLVAAIITKS